MNLLENVVVGGKQRAIDSYSLITANSKFTQHWIKEYWRRESEVLYPVCEDMGTKRVTKEKVILNVGRFFANSKEAHHKRQDLLVETFKTMPDWHAAGWQLHFAGSVGEDPDSLKYALQLVKEAAGLPVYFHFNCSFGELAELYGKAQIYWHATGYGSDVNKYPQKQEHFGITTVEAMSAGAIPIVYDSAGQRESVVAWQNGFLWRTSSELKAQTNEIIYHPEKFKGMAQRSKTDSRQFNKAAFNASVDRMLKPLL